GVRGTKDGRRDTHHSNIFAEPGPDPRAVSGFHWNACRPGPTTRSLCWSGGQRATAPVRVLPRRGFRRPVGFESRAETGSDRAFLRANEGLLAPFNLGG